MSKTDAINLIIAVGAFNAFLAIGTGAFAAHGLKDWLSVDYLNTFKTAADYQLIHGIGLIIIGILSKSNPNRYNFAAAAFMFIGIVLFLWQFIFTHINKHKMAWHHHAFWRTVFSGVLVNIGIQLLIEQRLNQPGEGYGRHSPPNRR